MKRAHTVLAALTLASAPLWIACSSDNAAAPAAPVAMVTVTPTPDTVRAGLTTALSATTTDAGGNVLTGRTITWASSNTMVATVNASGVVTGVGAGTATITATSEGQSGTASVTVWVGTTGSWAGTINNGGTIFNITASLTEDNAGAVTGTSLLSGASTWTVTGTNNTGGVADSVELTFSMTGTTPFVLNGNFDGVDTMSGLVNGQGCADCPTTFTRSTIAPFRVPAVRHVDRGVGEDLLKPRD